MKNVLLINLPRSVPQPADSPPMGRLAEGRPFMFGFGNENYPYLS